MRYKLLLTFLLGFAPLIIFAQAAKTIDFSKADSVALNTKYTTDIYDLTKQLTSPFPGKIVKVRAIFRWITDNIAYDFKYYTKYHYSGKEPKTYNCNDDDSLDCDIRKKVWETAYINKVLNSKKAVCQGYAMLFKKMCAIIGVEAEVIPGYVRTEYYQIGTMGELDHAWNAVKLEGAWYLLDATWAAGGCDKDDYDRLISFQKHFNEYYWLTPADAFARNHFPENDKWLLLPSYTKENFKNNPFYSPGDVGYIRLMSPETGVIAAKKGETIHFKVAYGGDIQNLQINSNIFQNPDIWTWQNVTRRKREKVIDSIALKKQQYIKYKRYGYVYEFDYAVKDNSLDYLELMFDTRKVVRFKMRVGR